MQLTFRWINHVKPHRVIHYMAQNLPMLEMMLTTWKLGSVIHAVVFTSMSSMCENRQTMCLKESEALMTTAEFASEQRNHVHESCAVLHSPGSWMCIGICVHPRPTPRGGGIRRSITKRWPCATPTNVAGADSGSGVFATTLRARSPLEGCNVDVVNQ